jgi:hypothetical protein
LENTTTNSDDPNAPMLIVKHRTHEGFYTYSINEPSYEIKPVKIQPVKIQPVKIHTIKKDWIAQRKNTLKKKEFRDSEKKQVSFERRNPVADEKRKVAKHFAEANALHDEKKALQDVKRKISEWIQANPEKVAQIEKEQRLRLESERPDMWASARNAMIEAALKMEIRKIIGLGNA